MTSLTSSAVAEQVLADLYASQDDAIDLARAVLDYDKKLREEQNAFSAADQFLLSESTEIFLEGIRCWICMNDAPHGGVIEHQHDCPVGAARAREEARKGEEMAGLQGGQLNALRWVRNTGYTGTKTQLFEDYEPIGPALWCVLHPKYIAERPDGKLAYTDAAKAILGIGP